MRIGKTFTFEAAHRLQRHDGKCRNLHGHSYKAEVSLDGELINDGNRPDHGMVVDFGQLKDWWRQMEHSLDHTTLLEASDPLYHALSSAGREGTSVTTFDFPPTAENLARWLFNDLVKWIVNLPAAFSGIEVTSVRVWETATSYAEVGF